MERVLKKAIATSEPFRFLIGPIQTEYTIHSALVAHQPPVLSTLVNGLFRESSECSVKWDDIDEIVFNSFWQFVYTGDYDTPGPLPPAEVILSEEEPKSDSSAEPELDEAAEAAPEESVQTEQVFAQVDELAADIYVIPDAPPPPAARMKKKRRLTRKTLLWLVFLFSWDFPSETFTTDVTLKYHANPLVHHAKVYVLADRYAVTRLIDLANKKLHQTLMDLDMREMPIRMW